MTWVPNRNNADNAQYTVLDGNNVLSPSPVVVNQRVGPGEAAYNGTELRSLGIYTTATNVLTVRLSTVADGNVDADAVFLVPATPPRALASAGAPAPPTAAASPVGKTQAFAATAGDSPSEAAGSVGRGPSPLSPDLVFALVRGPLPFGAPPVAASLAFRGQDAGATSVTAADDFFARAAEADVPLFSPGTGAGITPPADNPWADVIRQGGDLSSPTAP